MTPPVPSRLLVALVAPVLALAACGEPGTATAGSVPTVPVESPPASEAQGTYRATGTVLQAPGEEPQLCLGGVEESLPPQCGGPEVLGWDWDEVQAESAGGTTWGSYQVTGTYDGDTFTLTEPAAEPAPPAADSDSSPDFSSPCPEPAGGWVPPDPARATDASMAEAMALARAEAGHGGSWIDQRIPEDDLTESSANDPLVYVLNVTTTGDLDDLERRLRGVWGGSLCVSAAERAEADLRAVQDELSSEPGMLITSVDIMTGTVEVGVILATAGRQRELDQQYGDGVVLLRGALQPVG